VDSTTQTKPVMPAAIQGQIREVLTLDLSEEEARRDYPDVFVWLQENLDLAEVLSSYGIQLRPLCPERSDILVGAACPGCGGMIGVRNAQR